MGTRQDTPVRIFCLVTDEQGCDYCNSSGFVPSGLDSRLEEACPMCQGNGRLIRHEGEDG